MKSTTYITQILSCFILIATAFSVNAQCPTEAQLEGGGTLNIPTDNDCSAAVTCNIATADFWDIDGDITLQSCVTLTLTQGSSFIYLLGGTFTINEGATLIVNRRLVVTGATLIVNGTLEVGDGAGVDNLAVSGGGSIIVGATGNVDLGNGSVRVGSNTANSGTLTLNGTLSASGDVNIRGGGELEGSGQLSFGGTFNNTGSSIESFTGCSGTNTSCGATTLPVKFVSFAAKAVGPDRVALNWETASEVNNDGFFVERSHDGLHFENIGFVKGHGTTQVAHQYHFYDEGLSRNSYYRLRQVDFDGQYDYSRTSFVEIHASKTSLKPLGIYPNPVVDHFRFTNDLQGVFDWSLINMEGKQLGSFENLTVTQAEGQINTLLEIMEPGTYIIRLSNHESKQFIRLLKQ